jgi:hypothetical protein
MTDTTADTATAPTPAFDARTWLRARMAEGWSFSIFENGVVFGSPAPPRAAATPMQIERARIILRDHGAAVAAALESINSGGGIPAARNP